MPFALTPSSSLGYARDEHRSTSFWTQESNLELAGQSRASCRLDQSRALNERLIAHSNPIHARIQSANPITIDIECNAHTHCVRGAPGS